jgi:hypothetical protein
MSSLQKINFILEDKIQESIVGMEVLEIEPSQLTRLTLSGPKLRHWVPCKTFSLTEYFLKFNYVI